MSKANALLRCVGLFQVERFSIFKVFASFGEAFFCFERRVESGGASNIAVVIKVRVYVILRCGCFGCGCASVSACEVC